MTKIFITGTAGFIGFHLAKLLLNEGFKVCGYDAFTDYYDLNLKYDRHNILLKNPNYIGIQGKLEDNEKLKNLANTFKPDIIIHLAAQAGVRHSLEKPRSFIDSNIIGTFNIMEIARKHNIKHLLIASTSSVYGANINIPYREIDKTDEQISFYAATKKASESMAHTYSHLWKIPTTIFRFFTVYGPWGRPDMSYFKFVNSILNDKQIDIYNNGDMYRDFTYIDDLILGVRLLINLTPSSNLDIKNLENDTLSNVAPYRVVNIGNSNKIKLLDLIDTIELILGKKAIRNFMPLQKGDVKSTWADTSLLKDLTDFSSKTDLKEGIAHFVKWYRQYYNV